MGLMVGQLPRLSDTTLVKNGWIKEQNLFHQSGADKNSVVHAKLEFSAKPGQMFDHVGISDTVPLDPQFGKNITYDLDSPFAVKGRQDFVAFSGGNVSEKAQKLASLMTEYPPGVEFSMDGLSMEQLASLIGEIGKEIDRAFSAGEISEQEYADLNQGLDGYTDFMTNKAEKEKASFAVMKQTAAATRARIEGGASDQEMTNSAELVREKWQEKVDQYLKENSYHRTVLNQMIAAIRTGKTASFHAMA